MNPRLRRRVKKTTRLVHHAAQHVGTNNPISTIAAAQHEPGHVDTHCAVSFSTSPTPQVRAPERTKHSSQDGEHVSTSCRQLRAVYTPSRAGGRLGRKRHVGQSAEHAGG
mmetsp:Transcript_5914/g.23961  ORF Transcript_5914/g.23961 Transcript_5914/m.23961 type:complete len:110 (-) Transcript_5914:92-421(-)